ncbi:MAG: hypothetical protein CR988_01480 [Treponema sp.]|nr:MAG: hypothetical protein CR988_01480 [Treponema sp.]
MLNSKEVKFETSRNLDIRSKLLISEMEFRNIDFSIAYKDYLPLELKIDVNTPAEEFKILSTILNKTGRIPIPLSAQELWKHHKYSVMARSIPIYKKIGRRVSQKCSYSDFEELTMLLTQVLNQQPSDGGIKNVLQHLWGYISKVSTLQKSEIPDLSFSDLLDEICYCVLKIQEPYLMVSTAITELKVWTKI